MYKQIAEILDSSQTACSPGVPRSICKWPKLRYGESSLQFSLANAGDYLEYTFTDNPNLHSELGGDYTILRMLMCFWGGVFPDRYIRPTDFVFSISLYSGASKIIEWFLPAENSTLTSHDFDLRPLIGKEIFEFTKVRITALKANTSAIYLAGAYLLDDDFESSVKDTLEEMLNRKLVYTIGETVDVNYEGAEKIRISPEAAVRVGIGFSVNGEEHGIASFDKTEKYTEITLDTTGAGNKLLTKHLAGSAITGFVIATSRDIADSDDMYPRFSIMGSEIPPRDPLLAGSNQVFPRSSFIRDEIDGHKVGEQFPDKAYKYPVQIHIYAPDLDISQAMKKYLREIFDEDSFIDVAGNHYDYQMNGIDPQAEWDSFQAIPHTIMHLILDMDENLSMFQYRSFPTVKRLDLTISPYKVLTGA